MGKLGESSRTDMREKAWYSGQRALWMKSVNMGPHCIMNSTDPESRDMEERESGTSLNTMGPRLSQGLLLQHSQCFWGPGTSHEISKGHFWLPGGGEWGCLKHCWYTEARKGYFWGMAEIRVRVGLVYISL